MAVLTIHNFSDILIFRMQKISIIRDRNQLTIPEEAKKELSWIAPGVPVNVFTADDSLIIKPHYEERKPEWEKILRTMRKISKKGRRISLSEFVVRDRLRH